MTAGRDDLAWQGVEARLAAVERLIPDAPRWAGPEESVADGTLVVVRGANVRRVRKATGPTRAWPWATRLAVGVVAVAVAAGGLGWISRLRDEGPGTAAGLPAWTSWRWVPADGTALQLDITADRFVLHDDGAASATVALATSPITEDRIVVMQADAANGCAAGSTGEYRWQIDEFRITFTAAAEPCSERGLLLARTWVREFPRTTLTARQAQPGAYRLTWLRPAMGLTLSGALPITGVLEGPRVSPQLDDYWDASAGSGVIVVTRLDRMPVDACRAAAGDQPTDSSTPEEALASLRSVAGVEVGQERATKVGGLDAYEVDVGIVADCADARGRLWSAMPTALAGEGGDAIVAPGGTVRVLLVGVEGAVVAIAITPRSGQPNPVPLDDVAAELQPLIDSITFD